ncbi:MAG: putative toxin-antitoxin system toxin component, PIN family [Oscillospiraceae bacterium]|nr:putative toxin-antitoxin system toxin component, PIN family [Oscillospiraceae bacterium]
MRVMLDTNILVSAFVFRSKKIYSTIDYIVSKHELVLSTYVIEELRDVIARKFPKMAVELDEFLTTLSFTLAYSPQRMEPLFKIRDPADYPVLHTAIIEEIDILITGDKDFDDIEIEKPTIMTVAEFAKSYILGSPFGRAVGGNAD